eukprot:TRINITY_DN90306_c0_g1_i1.p1 TRINITY_DN90306_c0_g1~~TRINITY_DN90306_c0_g1_i1.p1  ORF type:complete len:414 (+),score=70.52 TRINITY_DN90306_c0_g1_i1:80-1321(+)
MGYGIPDSGVDFYYLTVREAYLLLKNDKAVFVDSRDEDDFNTSRIQTSFHLPANTLVMAHDKVDKSFVQHLIDLAASGKTIVALSDACVTGIKNRGHVSRCRHVCQYLVEMGADRTRCMRMVGGINNWKREQLDGIIGDLRPMYAGAIQDPSKFFVKQDEHKEDSDDEENPIMRPHAALKAIEAEHRLKQQVAIEEGKSALETTDSAQASNASGYAAADMISLEIKAGCKAEVTGLKSRGDLNGKAATVLVYHEDAGRWEVEVLGDDSQKELIRVKPENLIAKSSASVAAKAPRAPLVMITCFAGGDPRNGEPFTHQVVDVPKRPFVANRVTAYRVLKGDVFRRPSRDSEKIIKTTRPVSAIVRTTGEVFQGAKGGSWAQLDTTAGEKAGWVYIEGPGFGASSSKVSTEWLRA